MEIADRQHRKAMFDTKSYRADYLPKLSAVGVGFYNQKKYNYKLKGGYLPTYKPGENGQLEPNVMIDPATQKPVIGSDGNPVFNEYAFTGYPFTIEVERGLYGWGSARTTGLSGR